MDARKKTIFFIGIVSLGIGMVCVFFFYPLLGSMKRNTEELASQKKELANIYSSGGEAEKLKAFKEEHAASLVSIGNLFIDPEIPIEFIRFLQTAARESGLDFRISPGAPQKPKEDAW